MLGEFLWYVKIIICFLATLDIYYKYKVSNIKVHFW